MSASVSPDSETRPPMPTPVGTNHMAAESPARLTQVQQVLHSIQTHPEWPMANAALEMMPGLWQPAQPGCRIA